MWTWKELKCAYLPRVYLEFPFQGQPAEHFRAFPSKIFFFWDGLFLLYGCDTTVVWQCILVFFLFTNKFYKCFSILLQIPSKPVLTNV